MYVYGFWILDSVCWRSASIQRWGAPLTNYWKKCSCENSSCENCSHFWNIFEIKCSNISLKYVPIYSKIHRIRIRYSKYQFTIQNSPTMPKYIRKHHLFFSILEILSKFTRKSSCYFLFCINYIIHILHFLYIL